MAYKYEIIMYWSEEDEAFIAEVPDLPGCVADGRTYEETLAETEVIMDEWVETAELLGREIPQPSEHRFARPLSGRAQTE